MENKTNSNNYNEIGLNNFSCQYNPSVCWFCGVNKPNEDFKVGVSLYKEIGRGGVVHKKVTYRQTMVYIERCDSCAKIHSKGGKWLLLLFLLLEITSIILFVRLTENEFDFISMLTGGLIGMFPSVGIPLIIGKITDKVNSKKAGIKGINEIEKHPLVKEFIKDGWTTDKPMA